MGYEEKLEGLGEGVDLADDGFDGSVADSEVKGGESRCAEGRDLGCGE